MKMKEVIASFVADCKLRGLSAKTLEGYSHHLKPLPLLSPQFPPKPAIIQVFLANVKGVYNQDAHYRTFRALDNFAHKRFKTKNFMKSVTRPRIPKQIMPTLSSFELSLLAASADGASPRDKAILCLFIDTAIRSGEACNLKFADIAEQTITVHGKTGYRIVPISEITKQMLLTLPKGEDGYVFHGEDNTKYQRQPLKASGLYKVVRRYLKLAGYTGRQFGPQVLRRSFGVFWLKDGGDLKSLSLTLGHSSITTTANYYTPLLTEDIVKLHHQHTPIKVFEEVA